jgi:hypothetical protein
MGEERFASGEVLDHGTQEEDGPGTWEALAFLDSFRSDGESGDPFSDAGALADRAHGDKEKSPHRGRLLARETGARGRRGEALRANIRETLPSLRLL